VAARPVAARHRVAVVEDEDAAFGVPRLLLRGSASPGREGPVTWELRYGGLPVATGSLDSDQDVSFTDVAAIQPAMDSSGFTLIARYGTGEACAIEATCVRPVQPPTRAEAAARAKWPGTRNQREAPMLRQPFLAETRDISQRRDAGSGNGRGGHRNICIYQHFSVLLAYRHRIARDRAGVLEQADPGEAG
jgi:hypothetical protein